MYDRQPHFSAPIPPERLSGGVKNPDFDAK